MTDQELQHIESYLFGRLGQNEKLEIESKMKSDAEFKASVVQMKSMLIAIRQSTLDEKLSILKEEGLKYKGTAPQVVMIKPMYRWIAAAAVLLLGVFLIRPLFEKDATIQHPYLAEHFEDFVLHEIHKGQVNQAKNVEVLRAYNLYSIKEFKKAIPMLEKNWNMDRDTLSLFYLYVSAIGTGNEKLLKEYEKEAKNSLSTNKEYENRLNLLLNK